MAVTVRVLYWGVTVGLVLRDGGSKVICEQCSNITDFRVGKLIKR